MTYILKKDDTTITVEKQKDIAIIVETSTAAVSQAIKKNKPCKGWTITIQDDNKPEPTFEVLQNGNFKVSCENLSTWLGRRFNSFRHNEFTEQLEVNCKPITDNFINIMMTKSEKEMGIHDKQRLIESLTALCCQNPYHPLKERLESFEWDGKHRVEDFFIKYLGAKDTQLNRKYTKYWFKGAIKRLYEPGCNFDYMLILQDRQGGTGKSKIFARLALGYISTDIDVSNKDAINVMNNSWIVNFDELAQFDKKGMNTLKTFISTNNDINRLAYSKYAKDYKRHCVFCGTTNDEFFLRDYTTGMERRFWILNCQGTKRTSAEWSQLLPDSEIEQIWAEVLADYIQDPEINIDFTLEERAEMELIHLSHKSFGNDNKARLMLETILKRKYSTNALNDFMVFQDEIKRNDPTVIKTESIELVPVDWLAAAIDRSADYVKCMIVKSKDWTIVDNRITKVKQQTELEF